MCKLSHSLSKNSEHNTQNLIQMALYSVVLNISNTDTFSDHLPILNFRFCCLMLSSYYYQLKHWRRIQNIKVRNSNGNGSAYACRYFVFWFVKTIGCKVTMLPLERVNSYNMLIIVHVVYNPGYGGTIKYTLGGRFYRNCMRIVTPAFISTSI